MSTAITNRLDSPALKGQDAIVTMNGTDTLANIRGIFLGQRAVVSTSSDVGYVSEIDLYGVSFKVRPKYESSYFSSSVNSQHIGILSAGETVTIFPAGL